MSRGKDPYSVRNDFGDNDYRILSPEEYLELLERVVGRRAGDRPQAKEQLFNASFRLIEKQIGKILGQARVKAGFDQGVEAMGIDGRSDLFNAMAATVWKDFSKMVANAVDHDVSLFTIIANRVTHRLYSRFRREAADKRSAEFDVPEVLANLAANSVNGLEKLLRDEFRSEFLVAVNELDETAREVVKAIYFGIDSGQHLPIAQVARALDIPETTARSAFHRAIEKLKPRFAKGKDS